MGLEPMAPQWLAVDTGNESARLKTRVRSRLKRWPETAAQAGTLRRLGPAPLPPEGPSSDADQGARLDAD
jgi:hypothetical protein